MASPDWTTPDAIAISQRLAQDPTADDLFQVLRRLECVFNQLPRLGQAGAAASDPLRLGQPPSLAFAPAALATFTPASATPARLAVHCLGLLGPNGPLPLHLTEYAHERLYNVRDPTLIRFLDLLQHRFLTLFYRAWADAQPTVQLDRPNQDRFAGYVGALFGLGQPALRQRDAVADYAKLYYAGRLACQVRSAETLEAILADFFQLPVQVEQFVAHWLELPEDCHCRLGESPATGQLGINAVIGTRVWDAQHKFRLRFGPLSLNDYQRLLPGGDSLARLIAWVRQYLAGELIWDVQLILRGAEVPPLQLGNANARLGWSTWLTRQPLPRDAADLCLQIPCWTAD